jgi:glutamate/tyrosine decarboxylase-like PLP-dependent enzyme
MRFERESIRSMERALSLMEGGFSDLPDIEGGPDRSRLDEVMSEVAMRMRDNYPYFHPLYAGQMLKPPHPVARAAYMMSMWINPNNHALDGGRASSLMEREAVAQLAGMFDWEKHLGHLTGGGTMANMEALWVAGNLAPGKMIVASEQSHYTHERITQVLDLPFRSVPADSEGRMDIDGLREMIRGGEVGTVVATIGTTGTGSVDPLDGILDLREEGGFRVHADAAYGGYFKLVDNLSPVANEVYDRLREVDSIVIDPHKHGLQPYGCGCILFKDPEVGGLYRHDSPYTYFTSDELHLGEISLECSRAGASAVALWATQRMLPLTRGGELAHALSDCRKAAMELHGRLVRDDRFMTLMEPELDIVVWGLRGGSLEEISSRSEDFFDATASRNLHLAKFKYPVRSLPRGWSDLGDDLDLVTLVRSCMMKAEHLDWIDRIWAIIDEAANEVLG